MKVKVDNLSKVSFLGEVLIKKIYAIAYNLEADYVIVNKARYNKYAELELHDTKNGCIDWCYSVSV